MWPLMLAWSAQAEHGAVAPGRYGVHIKTATRSHVPVLGSLPGASVVWLLADVRQGTNGLELVQRTCSVEMEGAGERASVRLSPGFLAALPEKHHALEISADGQVFIDMGEDHVGYDPALYPDTLPEDADSPGVLDFDHDGSPGATVIVTVPVLGEIELYIVQHARSTLRGQLHDDGQLAGSIASLTLEQRTLDATHALMRMSPRMSLDASRSHWRMQPLPAEATCADLIARMCAQGGSGCPAE